jgi:hypothetical protein
MAKNNSTGGTTGKGNEVRAMTLMAAAAAAVGQVRPRQAGASGLKELPIVPVLAQA